MINDTLAMSLELDAHDVLIFLILNRMQVRELRYSELRYGEFFGFCKRIFPRSKTTMNFYH